jgi:Zn finger protein HypA/HybF involved in hydrogenase expression
MFSCDVCSKDFATYRGLNGHKRLHGESRGTYVEGSRVGVGGKKPFRQNKPCQRCGQESLNSKYCSNKCQNAYEKSSLIEDWLNGKDSGLAAGNRLKKSIRDHLLAEAEYKCSSCGWDKINPKSGKTPLEIDHIDGNSDNCVKDNLRVLCPNCHSLTPTYRALNYGRANKGRLRYSRLCK